jgi:hypothetical protein
MYEPWMKFERNLYETGKDFEWKMNEWRKKLENIFEYISNTIL